MIVILAVLGLGLAQGSHVSQNVVFEKKTDISTTQAQWILTFVIDLDPYLSALDKLDKDVNRTTQIIWGAAQHYLESTLYQGQRGTISRTGSMAVKELSLLGEEMAILRDTQSDLLKTFREHQMLVPGRSKRSILPFIGGALNFLFGTATDGQIDAIKANVKTLKQNQKTLAHVVEDSITILNASRVQISENRQTINELTVQLEQLDDKLVNISNKLAVELQTFEAFVTTYFSIKRVLTELQTVLTRITIYLEHLQLQTNMIALGRLTPSVITPTNLKKLLVEVNRNLRPPLRLPKDPNTNIWTYYQYLTCRAVMEDTQIMVIVSVPLLDMLETYEVFKIHNLPFPSMPAAKLGAKMTAKYRLEASAIAVDVQRTKFATLTEEETRACTRPLPGFCSIHSPIYPLNLNKFCVSALFKNDTKAVQTNCQTTILLDTELPTASYIANGAWAISADETLQFNILCDGRIMSRIQARPPIDIVRLDMGCTGASDKLTLSPYYFGQNDYVVNDSFLDYLRSYSLSEITIWKPVEDALPLSKTVDLPKVLPNIPQIDMQPLMRKLADITDEGDDKQWSLWKILITGGLGAIIVVVLIGLIFLCVRYKLYTKIPGVVMKLRKRAQAEGLESIPTTLIGEAAKAAHAFVMEGTTSSTPMLKDESAGQGAALKMYPSIK